MRVAVTPVPDPAREEEATAKAAMLAAALMVTAMAAATEAEGVSAVEWLARRAAGRLAKGGGA